MMLAVRCRRICRLVLLALIVLPLAAFAANAQVTSVQKQADGALLTTSSGILRLQVWSDRMIRVTFAPGAQLPGTKSFSVIGKPDHTVWKLREDAEAVSVETPSLRAQVNRGTGLIAFSDAAGTPILQEAGGRAFQPSQVPGVPGSSVQDTFLLQPGEQIYGLGQHQDGLMGYRGSSVHLQQKNMDVGIPMLVSSKGYGLLWDNPAVTDIQIGVKGKEDKLIWTSETGQAIDYYLFLGSPDAVIQSYRAITGPAPMMPRWFWGFWQCKERYASQEELTGVVARYRERKEPLDGIVQDWQYWKKGQWGTHEFDPVRYPDPAAMVSRLHAMNAHMMISVWSRFDVGTANAQELDRAGAVFPAVKNVFPLGEGRWYDPFSAEGRRLYWKQISERLFKLGVDGWWLDATEPEIDASLYRGFKTAEGPGAVVFNAYPLMTTSGVYSGQRAETDKQRVVILTRSAYAGQQRNAAVTWSGDIDGSWDVFKKQIPAGLNFSISGVPYWNTDIGGFFSEKPTNKQYQELFTRWFQFGAFNPMFRVHGTGAAKEIWQWDEPTQKIWSKYVGLRYRLLPYMYSVSWQVTNNGGTMLRPLVMDFASDPQALKIGDQFLFGPAVMVSPVTEAGAVSRSVYLPGKAGWYDFWTGRKLAGRRISAAAPIDVLPLAVRAGAIIPLGPSVQYTGEKPADPIELRVYRGANGAFTLYEDDGLTYGYEKGAYATITMTWDDAAGLLTIGARNGEFPGILRRRTFRVVFVRAGHGVGGAETAVPDQVVQYEGKAITVKAPVLANRFFAGSRHSIKPGRPGTERPVEQGVLPKKPR